MYGNGNNHYQNDVLKRDLIRQSVLNQAPSDNFRN